MERTSILKYIENNIERNGKLRENFTLEPYKKINPKGINFIDGAEDGMMLFHMKVEPQKEEILYITNLIKKASKDNIEETCIKLDEYFANNKIKNPCYNMYFDKYNIQLDLLQNQNLKSLIYQRLHHIRLSTNYL